MAKALNILYTAAEVYPYAKETGVADVAGGLPLTVKEYGHDIRLIMPRYGCTSDKKNKIHHINRTTEINVKMANGKNETFTIKSSSIPNTKFKLQVYVACNNKYFESRKGIYHDPVKWLEYSDNLERFIFYSRAVVETCVTLGWYPDVIHCNDWSTALVPVFIRYFYPQKFKKTKTILTIHNITDQGIFPANMFDLLGLPDDAKDSFIHKKQLNILKGGMLYANQITTVSEAYKEQISKNKTLTNGLNEIIKQNFDKIVGINNGIDTNYWNPRKDPLIKKKLGNDVSEFKQANKMALCKEFKLKYDENVPLLGVISRLDEQKGIDILIDAIPKIMENNVQLIILGQGNKQIKEKLSKLRPKYSKKMALIFAFDDNIAHKIEAGIDMYIMPSRQEACGLNFLYSLAYGTIPIANLVGGIKDNAVPINKLQVEDDSNCFGLKTLSEDNLLDAVQDAIKLYADKEKWARLINNVISKNYTWDALAAGLYDTLYRKVFKDD